MSDAVSFNALAAALRAEVPVVLATVVEGPGTGAKVLLVSGQPDRGSLPDPDLDRVVRRDAAAVLATGTTTVRRYGPHGEANETEVTVSYEVHGPPPRLVVFGATDFTAALTRVGKVLGYRITVCDARPVFATHARFPMADEVLVEWPHELLDRIGPQLGSRDAVCVLTHDARFDVPAIVAALATDVGYIGAMGSRRTTDDRDRRLREAGVTDEQLARVMAPIGLDIGARTPEETAVAICAEIITTRTGRAAASLKHSTGPIHA